VSIENFDSKKTHESF